MLSKWSQPSWSFSDQTLIICLRRSPVTAPAPTPPGPTAFDGWRRPAFGHRRAGSRPKDRVTKYLKQIFLNNLIGKNQPSYPANFFASMLLKLTLAWSARFLILFAYHPSLVFLNEGTGFLPRFNYVVADRGLLNEPKICRAFVNIFYLGVLPELCAKLHCNVCAIKLQYRVNILDGCFPHPPQSSVRTVAVVSSVLCSWTASCTAASKLMSELFALKCAILSTQNLCAIIKFQSIWFLFKYPTQVNPRFLVCWSFSQTFHCMCSSSSFFCSRTIKIPICITHSHSGVYIHNPGSNRTADPILGSHQPTVCVDPPARTASRAAGIRTGTKKQVRFARVLGLLIIFDMFDIFDIF